MVFDDFLTIQSNEGVRFGDNLFSPQTRGGRGLLYLTFAVSYALHEQEVWGYHLVNVTLHLLNGLMLLFIALYTFRRLEIEESKARIYALLGALFFVCHPIQTQAVTYISSRSETLSTFFYLLAVLVFVRAPSRSIGFVLSLFVGAIMYAGLMSKETVISLPAALLVYDFLFLSGGKVRGVLDRWKFYLPFLVGGAAAGYYLLTGPLRNAVGSAQVGNLTPWYYLLTESKVILRYIQLTLLPIGQNLDHDIYPSTSLLEPVVLASSVTLVCLLGLAWFVRIQCPVVSFSILWFFVTLAPTSSFVPIVDFMFEHRMYLPMVGICMSFPILIDLFGRTLKERIRFRPRLVPVAAGILTALTIATVMRNGVWQDEVTLWADVIEKSPGKLRGHNALAMAYFRKGEFDEGLRVAREGLELFPEQRNGFADSIGNMLLQLGRYDEAVEVFGGAVASEAAKAAPDTHFLAMEFNNLGVAYLWKWRVLRINQQNISTASFEEEKRRILEPALEAFNRALEYESGMRFTSLDSYTNIMYDLGRGDELRRDREAILAELDWEAILAEVEELDGAELEDGTGFESTYILGKLGFNVDDFETAVAHFEEAAELEPRAPLFWFNYGYSLNQLGRQDQAIEAYTEAMRLNPVFVEAHHNVGQLRMLRMEYDMAISNFEEVLRLYPGHISANLRLATIYLEIDQPAVARRHALTVLETSPNDREALDLLARIG
jgi:tetratricopeptide (TPR) repeat protein